MTLGVIESAAKLTAATPASQAARVAGKLDMIRHSTRSFGVTLDTGEEVRGHLSGEGAIEDLSGLFGRRVVVSGRAVYRPSGRLLRLDAEAVEEGAGAPALWSKIPVARTAKPEVGRGRGAAAGARGAAGFFGIWPGTESDEELAEAAREVRRR